MGRRPKEKQIDINDIVYLRSDPEKLPRLVVGVITKYPEGVVKYKLSIGSHFSKHWEFEIERTVQDRLKIKGLCK